MSSIVEAANGDTGELQPTSLLVLAQEYEKTKADWELAGMGLTPNVVQAIGGIKLFDFVAISKTEFNAVTVKQSLDSKSSIQELLKKVRAEDNKIEYQVFGLLLYIVGICMYGTDLYYQKAFDLQTLQIYLLGLCRTPTGHASWV